MGGRCRESGKFVGRGEGHVENGKRTEVLFKEKDEKVARPYSGLLFFKM